MDAQPECIPVFPLPLASLPMEIVPLHIFEERYKEMIGWCLRRQKEGKPGLFLLCFSDGKRVEEIGVAMKIEKALKTYSDGRMDILTVGQYRCRRLNLLEEESFHTANIETFSDSETDWRDDLATRAYSLHRELIKSVTGKYPSDNAYSGKSGLSFHLASTSGLVTGDKQKLLEMTRENERIEFLISHLEKMLADLNWITQAIGSIRLAWDLRSGQGRTSAS